MYYIYVLNKKKIGENVCLDTYIKFDFFHGIDIDIMKRNQSTYVTLIWFLAFS